MYVFVLVAYMSMHMCLYACVCLYMFVHAHTYKHMRRLETMPGVIQPCSLVFEGGSSTEVWNSLIRPGWLGSQPLKIFLSSTFGLQVCATLASKKRKQNLGFRGCKQSPCLQGQQSTLWAITHPPAPKLYFPVSFPVKVGGGPREDAGLEKQANSCGEEFGFCLPRVPKRLPLTKHFKQQQLCFKIKVLTSSDPDEGSLRVWMALYQPGFVLQKEMESDRSVSSS